MIKIVLHAITIIVFAFTSCAQKKNAVHPGELDIHSMIQPIPATAKFINDTSYIWCGTLVRSHIDQKYHLFYSRWPRKDGMSAWVTSSEVAHAISDSPFGPFQFKDVTLPHRGAEYWDGMYTHNPTVSHMPDGRFLMVYKAVARKRPQPFGGPVVHLTAIAENPEGPFVKQNKPIFTAENVDFPAEDPFVWYQDNCYYAIVKDMKGAFTDAGRSLVLFYSPDGLDWKLATHPLVSSLNIIWEDGTTQNLEALERPQLFFENGKMVALLCAVNENQGHSYNIQIPLKTP